ncbi:MAG: RHS repeat domain-containing protein [Anaerolineaceae bacterium]
MPKRLPDYSEPISITFTDDGEVDLNELYEIVGRLSKLQSGQSASLLNLEFTYDSVGNILTITDQLNNSQVQTFGYDALNRLISASTNGVGEGQYSQSYSYDPATGNLSSMASRPRAWYIIHAATGKDLVWHFYPHFLENPRSISLTPSAKLK